MVNLAGILGQLGDLGTVGLLVALVIMFVVAFKVLEMVFQTIMVAALSGGFYFAISYYLEAVSFSLNSLLFFAFLGGSLYTGYYLVLQGYSILSLLISLPVRFGKSLVEEARELKRRRDTEDEKGKN